MKRYAASVLTAAVALVAASVGTAMAVGDERAEPGQRWIPPHDTIVKVAGTPEDGFAIHHYDGSVLYPPTDSEARAECLEYDTKVSRVRCRTEIATWYADLEDMKVALRWANRRR
jgi:hypothetical protein